MDSILSDIWVLLSLAGLLVGLALYPYLLRRYRNSSKVTEIPPDAIDEAAEAATDDPLQEAALGPRRWHPHDR